MDANDVHAGYRDQWNRLAGGIEHRRARGPAFSVVLALSFALAACGSGLEKSTEPEIRPVRTVTVEKRPAGMPMVLTGRIAAEDEARLAFRLSGRMVERSVNVGDRVEAGQLIARLDPQDQQNALQAAEANLGRARSGGRGRERVPAPAPARGARLRGPRRL